MKQIKETIYRERVTILTIAVLAAAFLFGALT